MMFNSAGNGLQAYEALRELVRKVECGEVAILNMNITQEAPETREFNSYGSGFARLTRLGDMTIEMKLAFTGRLSEPGYARDEAGRLRVGTVSVPRDKPYSQMSRDEILQMAGITPAQQRAIEDDILRDSIPKEPSDPLKYGARKLDID